MRAAGVVIAAAALLGSGIVIGRYFHPSTWLSTPAPALPVASPQATRPPVPSTGILDTSRLPLLLNTIPIAGTGRFAVSEDLPGGAVARVEQSLLVMDRVGHIFVFEHAALRRMDYDPPSGITKALYLAYDESRGTIYVSHLARPVPSEGVRFTIASLAIDKRTLATRGQWQTVFETGGLSEDAGRRGGTGGKMLVTRERLYFSVGDFSVGQIPVSPFDFAAQDPSSPFGKIFDHDLTTKATAVSSTGHRNSQGLVWTTSGTLMSTEHGPEGGDELNIIVPGGNYGWPYRTHGVGYGTFEWPAMPHATARFIEPVFAWVPSPAISAVIEVAGFHDRWNGDLLVGSLEAQTLFRLKVANSRVLYSEGIQIGSRIRDLVQMPNQIALITDDPALVLISVDEERLKQNARLPETGRR